MSCARVGPLNVCDRGADGGVVGLRPLLFDCFPADGPASVDGEEVFVRMGLPQKPTFAFKLFKAIAAVPHEPQALDAASSTGSLPRPPLLLPAPSGEGISTATALTVPDAPKLRRLDILRRANCDAEVRVVRDPEHLEHSETDFVDAAYEEGSQEAAQRSWD